MTSQNAAFEPTGELHVTDEPVRHIRGEAEGGPGRAPRSVCPVVATGR